MTADPIGDAIRADAEAARAGIRAAGLICPSCGVNMADLRSDHVLTLIHGREHEDDPERAPTAQCNYGSLVLLADAPFARWQAAAAIAMYDDFRKREADALDRIIGERKPGHEYTGILDAPDTLDGQP